MPAARPIQVTSPLGDGVLLFRRMTADERLGQPFQFDLDLLSESAQIKLEDVVGKTMTVALELPGGEMRYFDGYVSRFSFVGVSGRYFCYQATLRPWLWLLTRNADCRIFQQKTVPDIIKQIFRDRGFSDFEEALSGSYPAWEYCVQYRETDFNFVSRLMEQEGIYYFFKHSNGKHTLVLADSYSAHEAVAGYDEIPYFPPDDRRRRERDHIFDWYLTHEMQPGKYALNDYDFKKPKASLLVKSVTPVERPGSQYEIYDYPGEYVDASAGETYARARIEELAAQYEQAHGAGNARGLSVGALFSLSAYPREDQNREYLLVSATHELQSDVYESAPAPEGTEVYTCRFVAIESKQPYRAPRLTPKPVVQGPQTAIVTGKSGEEIWTDEHGRVKVQFHWDRYGQQDENSSCWVRVSQVHAGKGFGAIDTPRIGEEVIVSFLEGDPDRPIITGRVYNGDNRPPNGLPAAAMVSGLKSNSTPGGGGNNAMMLDDTKGNEKVSINGQYNMDTSVGNNQTNTVGVDQSNSVGSNQKEDIGANRDTSVGAADKLSVGSNRTTSIGANHSVSVGGSEDVSISGSRKASVGGAEDVSIGGKSGLKVGGSRTETIGGAHTIVNPRMTITSAAQFTVAAGSTFTGTSPKVNILAGSKLLANSGGKLDVKAGAALTQQSGAAMNVKSGAGLNMQSSAAMNLKSGAAMKSQAGGAMNLKAGGAIIGKGSVIKLNSPTKIKGTTLTVE